MSVFKLVHIKYTKRCLSQEGCNDIMKKCALPEYTFEVEEKEEKAPSQTVYEEPHLDVSYTFTSEDQREAFSDGFDVGKIWLSFHLDYLNHHACWLALRIKKTSKPLKIESEHRAVAATDFRLGALVNFTWFMTHFSFRNSPTLPEVKCSFQHDRKELNIFFHSCSVTREITAILVRYNWIYRIIISYELPETVYLYIHLKNPPLLFKEGSQVTSLDFPNYDATLDRSIVGNCTAIMLSFKESEIVPILNRMQIRCPTLDFVFCDLLRRDLSFYNYSLLEINTQDFCFDCNYAWNVLLNHGFTVLDQFITYTKPFTEVVNFFKERERNHEIFQHVCYAMFLAMDKGRFVPFFEAFRFYYAKIYKNNIPRIAAPDGMCVIRKVVLTPTRSIFLQPQQHVSNRVFRNIGDPEFALQVSIKQEDMDKLSNMLRFHENYRKFMDDNFHIKKGLFIGDRHYEFLACSNSQLREHGFWMYARDRNNETSADIMEKIGLAQIRGNAAKKLSRMGLFFSSSENSHLLPDECIVITDEEDITRGKYTFSDGIGMISSKMAEKLYPSSGEDRYNPSAFQIRYMGFKGMLLINNKLPGLQIRFRGSMNKFDSNSSDRVIDILKTSGPRRLFLNRSLNMILEEKGVRAEEFLKLQEEMLHKYSQALMDDACAAEFLDDLCPIKFPFKELQKAGLSIAAEPFFRRLLVSFFQKRIGLLRTKANIAVPPNEGRNMLGVIDEFGVLEPDQVFIQYSQELDLRRRSPVHTLKGPVIVTRNPCHHPGDVRLMTAVDSPKVREMLGHINDCVVFSAKGNRPPQDMMGGGDLDGDEFVVIWKRELRFKKNSEPMDYPDTRREKEPSQVTVNDMVNFFYQYIHDDILGLFCNAHLVAADTEPKRIFSEKCERIAKKIPKALDYNKTGESVKLENNEKPPEYPDFMEKGCLNTSYKSDSVLGKLYRKICMHHPPGLAIREITVIPDDLFNFPSWEEYENIARTEKSNYEEKLTSILSQYGLGYFEESITGHMPSNNYYSMKSEQENLVTILEKNISRLVQDTKERFYKCTMEEIVKLKIVDENQKERLKMKMASAWYMVTYSDESSKDLSFPWCIGEWLCKVAQENYRGTAMEANRGFLGRVITELNDVHGIKWVQPSLYIRHWADAHQICPNSFLYEELLDNILSEYTNSIPCITYTQREALKIVIGFFDWLSSSRMKLKFEEKYKQTFLEKIVILASMTYTCLPLTLDLAYLGFPNPAEEGLNGPLDMKEYEILRVNKENFSVDIQNMTEEFEAQSGVSVVLIEEYDPTKNITCTSRYQQQTNGRKSNGPQRELVIKARGLMWQLLYLEKLIYEKQRPKLHS